MPELGEFCDYCFKNQACKSRFANKCRNNFKDLRYLCSVEERREFGEAGQPDGEERERADQHQRMRSTGVNQLLLSCFVGHPVC